MEEITRNTRTGMPFTPISGLKAKPIKRRFKPKPKIGTNKAHMRNCVRKLKNRHMKLLKVNFKSVTDLNHAQYEARNLECELLSRTVVDDFAKSGSPKSTLKIATHMFDVWRGLVERIELETFDHGDLGAYFWGPVPQAKHKSREDAVSGSDPLLEAIQEAQINAMIALKIIKTWEVERKVAVNNVTSAGFVHYKITVEPL